MAKAKSATSRKTKIAFVAAIIVGFASPSFAQHYGPYAPYGYGRGYSPYGYGAYGSVNEPYYFPPTGYFAAHGEFYTRYTIPPELTHWFERNPPYFNN
jgi:hypothetical protein